MNKHHTTKQQNFIIRQSVKQTYNNVFRQSAKLQQSAKHKIAKRKSVKQLCKKLTH